MLLQDVASLTKQLTLEKNFRTEQQQIQVQIMHLNWTTLDNLWYSKSWVKVMKLMLLPGLRNMFISFLGMWSLVR